MATWSNSGSTSRQQRSLSVGLPSIRERSRCAHAARHGREGDPVKFVSTRIITADVRRLVDFYEMVTEVPAIWGNELFAEIPTPVGVLAIGSDKTVPLFGQGSAEPAANRSAIIEFIVDDVDAEYERLRG